MESCIPFVWKCIIVFFFFFLSSQIDSVRCSPPIDWLSDYFDWLSDYFDYEHSSSSSCSSSSSSSSSSGSSSSALNADSSRYPFPPNNWISNYSDFVRGTLKDGQLREYTIIEKSPSELVEKHMDSGTFALHLYELRCLCKQGSKCYNGIGECKDIKRMVPIMINNGTYNNHIYDLVSVTIGCVCVVIRAPEAGHTRTVSLTLKSVSYTHLTL